MASKVSVDTASLRSSASRVNGIASDIENELSTLEQIILTTADAWEGSAKVSFENAFRNTYKKNLTEIKESLRKYAQAMTTYADETDETTSRGARRFDSI